MGIAPRPRWVLSGAFACAALAGAAVSLDATQRLDATLPPPSVASAAVPMTSPPGRADALPGVAISSWNGVAIARGDRGTFVVDVASPRLRALTIGDSVVVHDVAMWGQRPAALVTRPGHGAPSLLVREADPGVERWREHALPPAIRAGGSPHPRLFGAPAGLAAFSGERTYLLTEDAWHEAPTFHFGKLAPVRALWSRDRWYVQYYGGSCAFGSANLVLGMNASAGDVRVEPAERSPDVLQSMCVSHFRSLVRAPDDEPWISGAEGCAPRALVPRGPVEAGDDAGGLVAPTEAQARGRTWLLGPQVTLKNASFDDAGRPIVGAGSFGVLRQERDHTWTWLTPGWPAGSSVVAGHPIGDALVVVSKEETVGVVQNDAWIVRWLALPEEGDRASFTASGVAADIVPHAVVQHPRQADAFVPIEPSSPSLTKKPSRRARTASNAGALEERAAWSADFAMGDEDRVIADPGR